MSPQTKTWSFIEALAQTAIGFVQGVLTQMLLFPLYGWTPTLIENIQLVFFFTIVSLLRSYAVRRAFNWIFSSQ